MWQRCRSCSLPIACRPDLQGSQEPIPTSVSAQEGHSLEGEFAMLTPNELLTHTVPELRRLVGRRRQRQEDQEQADQGLAAAFADGPREVSFVIGLQHRPVLSAGMGPQCISGHLQYADTACKFGITLKCIIC